MGIKISEFGIEVPGKVVRTIAESSDGIVTTITLDAKQAAVVHEATGAVLDFVSQQQELPMNDEVVEVKAKAVPK